MVLGGKALMQTIGEILICKVGIEILIFLQGEMEMKRAVTNLNLLESL